MVLLVSFVLRANEHLHFAGRTVLRAMVGTCSASEVAALTFQQCHQCSSTPSLAPEGARTATQMRMRALLGPRGTRLELELALPSQSNIPASSRRYWAGMACNSKWTAVGTSTDQRSPIVWSAPQVAKHLMHVAPAGHLHMHAAGSRRSY
ncbi:hypothetical protein CC86DRAFT_102482 [Ophiobolus disseminans]|uniref:Uncharacterized protein n=1 Tax=Ophiobolus disseminans TaxID=1469910 RepID=A0A6A6ZK22_9PLEO|nr:hypothetical protein CC86DRAFT_102482 [Ophiobolus disseminans]